MANAELERAIENALEAIDQAKHKCAEIDRLLAAESFVESLSHTERDPSYFVDWGEDYGRVRTSFNAGHMTYVDDTKFKVYDSKSNLCSYLLLNQDTGMFVKGFMNLTCHTKAETRALSDEIKSLIREYFNDN